LVLVEQAKKSPIAKSDWDNINRTHSLMHLMPEFLDKIHVISSYSENLMTSLKSFEESKMDIGRWGQGHLEAMIVKQLFLCLYSIEKDGASDVVIGVLEEIQSRAQEIFDHYIVDELPNYPSLLDHSLTDTEKDTLYWSSRVAAMTDRCLIEIRQTLRAVYQNPRFQGFLRNLKPLRGKAAKILEHDTALESDALWHKLQEEHSRRMMNQMSLNEG
jgi:hypothetical protein